MDFRIFTEPQQGVGYHDLLQLRDLTDLDQIELIAAEVMPQLR